MHGGSVAARFLHIHSACLPQVSGGLPPQAQQLSFCVSGSGSRCRRSIDAPRRVWHGARMWPALRPTRSHTHVQAGQ
jgi:hypothetical protein